MQPVKIVIPGRYWDSFIYRGDLYLWDIDGSIRTIDWDTLISEWNIDSRLCLPMRCAFLRSDYLYQKLSDLLFGDPDIQKLLKNKFLQLSSKSMIVEQHMFCTHEKGQQDNPFPFPHSDLDIYDRRAYVAGPSGVANASIGKNTKHPVSTRVKRQWDAPVRRVSAGYGSLAMAAGDEGLFEASLAQFYWHENGCSNGEPIRLSDDACIDCNWTYWSIFASNRNGGFLASFQIKKTSMNHQKIFFGSERITVRKTSANLTE